MAFASTEGTARYEPPTRQAVLPMNRNPYRIEGPALISFSGGRTSGYMLWHIIQAHGGTLPDDIRVTFANTGKEMPATLDFVQACGNHWGVEIMWLEYRYRNNKQGFEIVTYETASRSGEPFDMVIENRKMLPNPVTRFCTQDLKIRTFERYAKSIGLHDYTSVIGLRADEPHRVARARARNALGKDRYETAMPCADAGATKNGHIIPWWERQNFDLRLENVRGSTPAGNCDLCFLKGAATVAGLVRGNPELADWWAAHEAREVSRRQANRLPGHLVNLDVARFRMDRPSYAEMQRMARSQGDLFPRLDDNTQPCNCHD